MVRGRGDISRGVGARGGRGAGQRGGRGAGQRGGRGAGQRGGRGAGRGSKPRCARSLHFPILAIGNSEAVEPTPGPSGEQSRPKTLVEQLKAYKEAKALDAKNIAKLTLEQRTHLTELRQKKQVGNFKMPDSPIPTEPKKGKGKGKGKSKAEDTRVWIPCPLLPGVPTVPPPRVPQPWEVQCQNDITKEEDDVIEGTPPRDIIPHQLFAQAVQPVGTDPRTAPDTVMDITEEEDDVIEGTPPRDIIPQHLFAQAVQPVGTPPRTAPDTVMDITEEETWPLLIIPGSFAAEAEAKTPPRKKKRIMQFSPSTGIIQSAVPPENPVSAEIELVGFTPSSTTSTAAPGSGRSAYEIDVNMEVNFPEPDEGSDIEAEDNLVDISLKPPKQQIDVL